MSTRSSRRASTHSHRADGGHGTAERRRQGALALQDVATCTSHRSCSATGSGCSTIPGAPQSDSSCSTAMTPQPQ
jgi:hypothetical protein